MCGHFATPPATYFQSVQGAHKACVYEHLGFGFVFDETPSLEALKPFPVVCLPNAAIVSEREVEVFRRYVEEGGKPLHRPMWKLWSQTTLPPAPCAST